jgi:hypothetical protein
MKPSIKCLVELHREVTIGCNPKVELWIEEVQKLGTTVLQNILDLLAFSSLMFFLSLRLFGALFTYSLVGTVVSVWYFFPRITGSHRR